MNVLSLTHSYAQNQPTKTSWIDDPFDLKGFVTGVTKVSHERNLSDYAQELVASYAKFSGDQYQLELDKLSSPCQLELARLYIEFIDREIEWACYGEDQTLNSDFLCALLQLLKDNTPQTRDNFAQVTMRNILIYYKDTLQEILNSACTNYYCNEMHEAGYHTEQDLDHGDVLWRR